MEMDKPLSTHVLNHNTANTKNVRCALGIYNLCIFSFILFHYLMHFLANISKNIIQEHHCSSACAHAKYKTKGNMANSRMKVEITSQFNDLEELLQIYFLIRSNHINPLVKIEE